MPQRAARIRPGSAVFKHLALERWTNARELHTVALRNRSQVAFHTLRIGIKRFRYIVENFLPAEHQAWANDLKRLQDLLGDVHDLDVLWATALSHHVFTDDPRARPGTSALPTNGPSASMNIARKPWGRILSGMYGALGCPMANRFSRLQPAA